MNNNENQSTNNHTNIIIQMISHLDESQLLDVAKNLVDGTAAEDQPFIRQKLFERAGMLDENTVNELNKIFVDSNDQTQSKVTTDTICDLKKDDLTGGNIIDLLYNSFRDQYLEAGDSRTKVYYDLEKAVMDHVTALKLPKTEMREKLRAVKKMLENDYKTEKRRAEQEAKNIKKEEKQNVFQQNTHFLSPLNEDMSPVYPQYKCDGYIVEDAGIWKITADGTRGLKIIGQPVIIICVLKNRETGFKLYKIAFKSRGHWQEIPVSSETIFNRNKIITLANFGCHVTSENAKYLVKYLSTILELNEDIIPEVESTHKMGWCGNDYKSFSPYSTQTIYDGQNEFLQRYLALTDQKGSPDVWMQEIRDQRRILGNTLMIPMASALASPLIPILGVNNYILDIYGTTQNAKSVLLMLIASMFGNPELGNGIIGNFMMTVTGIETFANMLNNFPLILDDSKSADAKVEKSFEALIYMLCNGKGKQRSNKDLGNDYERTWRLTVLTSGEKPLAEKVQGGGAIGRVLEMPVMDHKIFNRDRIGNTLDDTAANLEAHRIAEFAKANHGWFFRRWIDVIINMDVNDINSIYEDMVMTLSKISGINNKQTDSLAVILTADKIIEQGIFKDNLTIDIQEASGLLMQGSEIDDNVRAYRYLCELYVTEPSRFEMSEDYKLSCFYPRVPQLGADSTNPGYVHFFVTALEKELETIGISCKTFTRWAKNNGYLYVQGSQTGCQNTATINGKSARVYTILIDPEAQKNETQSNRQLPDFQDLFNECPFDDDDYNYDYDQFNLPII